MRLLILCVLLSAFMTRVHLNGQSVSQSPNYRAYHILDRWDIKYQLDHPYHSSVKYIAKKDFSDLSKILLDTIEGLDILVNNDINYLLNDYNEYNPGDEKILERFDKREKPFLKYFYKTPANFFEVNTEDFILRANPIINIKFGKEDNSAFPVFQNTRGAEIRGTIDQKVYFYTAIFENQQRFYNFIQRRIEEEKAIPGQGFYKDYESGIWDRIQGYDFLNAQGYVGIPISKSIALEFGHGKHFLGNGYHSLLLNDYAHNYFYLKFNTRVWKFHYQNIFAELSAIGSRDNIGDELIPKKYMAAHYLSFKPNPKWELGIYEAVIFNRANQFEFQYLNPIILYRTVEQFLDSPDNVLLGLNAKWNFAKSYSLYGQFMLDELKISELTSGNGWWGNKYGLQIGVKAIDFLGIDRLDLQLEYNAVRPYTYAHVDTLENFQDLSIASYSHYNQALAHPLGANFKEFLMLLKYQPSSRLFLSGRVIFSQFGDDDGEINYGGDILRSYLTRNEDFGNKIGQGVSNDIFILGMDLSYELYHNYYLDLHLLLRNQDSEDPNQRIDTRYIGGGIRINVSNQKLNY